MPGAYETLASLRHAFARTKSGGWFKCATFILAKTNIQNTAILTNIGALNNHRYIIPSITKSQHNSWRPTQRNSDSNCEKNTGASATQPVRRVHHNPTIVLKYRIYRSFIFCVRACSRVWVHAHNYVSTCIGLPVWKDAGVTRVNYPWYAKLLCTGEVYICS